VGDERQSRSGTDIAKIAGLTALKNQKCSLPQPSAQRVGEAILNWTLINNGVQCPRSTIHAVNTKTRGLCVREGMLAGLSTRMALCAIGLSLTILCSGCAWWDRSIIADAVSTPASLNGIAPTATIELTPQHTPLARRGLFPATSNEPEDFLCQDGSRLRVSYPNGRDVVAVSVNGAESIAMHRVDEAGFPAYRAGHVWLRRSGIRVALASEMASVIVRRGDTLGEIAFRIYGDRMRAMDIARLNNIDSPDLIFPGQTLKLEQAERRCRRSHHQEAAYAIDGAAAVERSRALDRRAFSPPSYRQPEQRRIRATAVDPPLR
jgi:LysM repeat protein